MKFFFLKMTNTITSQNIVFPSESTHIYDILYEGWNFNSGNYLFTTDTK